MGHAFRPVARVVDNTCVAEWSVIFAVAIKLTAVWVRAGRAATVAQLAVIDKIAESAWAVANATPPIARPCVVISLVAEDIVGPAISITKITATSTRTVPPISTPAETPYTG